MKPGIYRDMDSAVYFADPCPEPSLSQSIAKVMLDRSAWHAASAHPRLPPYPRPDAEGEKYEKAKAIGNAAHAIMIGRGKTIEIVKANDFKGKDAKAVRDAAYAAGRTPVLEKHFETATEIVASGLSQLKYHEFSDAFQNGSGEVALIWQEDDGIWCRALVDWLSSDLRTVDDYKTSGMSMAPHVIGLRAETAGWHVQAAFIERGLDILDAAGAGRRQFRFIAQEQDEPYALNAMPIDEYWLTMGRKRVAAAMSLWRSCIKTGRWPGYPRQATRPDFPAHREKAWLERELSGEFEPENDHTLTMAG